MKYQDFLKTKDLLFKPCGLSAEDININDKLFDYQKDIVSWALQKGRSCIFADCGLGKTFMQIEWARIIYNYTSMPVLIIAPLAVNAQTIEEAKKINVVVENYSVNNNAPIQIINYDNIHKVDITKFSGIVLDESSILKNFSGKTRNDIINSFAHTPYKLACTATPSPNDFMELGNHAEFVGAMSYNEMLSMFFVHDGGETSKWRLKGHAKKDFWKWISTWAVLIRKPSDLGYSDEGFILPEIEYKEHILPVDSFNTHTLIPLEAVTLQERRAAKKTSIDKRISHVKEIIADSQEQWIIWCEYNEESTKLKNLINGAVEVKGSDDAEFKKESFMGFAHNKYRVLVTKPKMGGFGMNWQNCHNMIFASISDSYESFYQSVRRIYRFGQRNKVTIHLVLSETERAISYNLTKKEKDANEMSEQMVSNLRDFQQEEIKRVSATKTLYNPTQQLILPKF